MDSIMETQAILIKEEDNVATALTNLDAGSEVNVKTGEDKIFVSVKDAIPSGHKFAVKKILKGESIIKYGEIIGRATEDIDSGRHAHIQNIESLRGRGDREGDL